jgi:hypothetical protein
MVYFQTKTTNLGKFWRALVGLLYGRLEYITAVWYILCECGNLVAIGIFYPVLVHVLCQEKSGNPDCDVGQKKLK